MRVSSAPSITSCSSATKSVRVRVRVMIRARGRVALEGVSAFW